MQATLHDIEARLTDDEPAPAARTNFRLGPGDPTDANRAVAEAGWSLYCLDLSEPDFAFDMLMQRASLAPEAARRLLAAGVRLLFRPPPGRSPRTLAIKFRKQELHQDERFHEVFPAARYVFMHRDGLGWVRSFWYMLANFGLPPALDRETRRFLWWIKSANADPAALAGIVDMAAETVYPKELLAASWSFDLAEYRRLLAAGVPFLALCYDELQSDRAAVAERLLRHCGLPSSAVPAALRAFDRDSPAGTSIARDHRAGSFGEASLARFRATLARCPGAAPTDAVLPDVYSAEP